MITITDSVALSELRLMAENQFGSLIKGVVDIEKCIMAVGGEMHADEEAHLIDEGSSQENLWGINIHPEKEMPERIEFDSMINIRPYLGNRSRSVENHGTQKRILEIVSNLIKE
ncbi:MAG: hypothetical protein EPN85_10725 [Bacteroidetes bacterium]|nr:MAG: hypothetical protein EPN85_10725 [Bacteroidota bacterium]